MAESDLVAPPDTAPRVPKLTVRQTAFVAEYLIDLNGSAAAVRAGYAAPSASVEATRLLANDSIRSAIERGKAQRASRVGMTQDTVLHEMSLLANSCLEHYVITDDGQVALAEGAPEGAMRAIQSIKKKTKIHYDSTGAITGKDYDIELRLWDKPNPLKLMGKHVGLNFSDRVEVTGKDGGPVITEVRSVIVDPKKDDA